VLVTEQYDINPAENGPHQFPGILQFHEKVVVYEGMMMKEEYFGHCIRRIRQNGFQGSHLGLAHLSAREIKRMLGFQIRVEGDEHDGIVSIPQDVDHGRVVPGEGSALSEREGEFPVKALRPFPAIEISHNAEIVISGTEEHTPIEGFQRFEGALVLLLMSVIRDVACDDQPMFGISLLNVSESFHGFEIVISLAVKMKITEMDEFHFFS
jgi:hypothetical protein